MTALRGRTFEALLLIGLLSVEEFMLVGLLIPEGLAFGLLTGLPVGFSLEGVLLIGSVAAGFSSVATGWEGLS